MKKYTEAERAALIEDCQREIAHLKRCIKAYPYEPVLKRDLIRNEIALAALTAQPVKLPQRYICEGYHIDEAYLTADDDGDCFDREEVIEAIRAAGYEVIE